MIRSIIVMLCCIPPLSALAEDLRPIVVRHASGVSVTDDRVRAIIAEMNDVMDAAPGCGQVRFYRSGAPGVSDRIPFTVEFQSQSRDLMRSTDIGNVLIAHRVQFCGDPGTYGGCSDDNLNALVRWFPERSARLNALVWLHEIGHSHTLRHVQQDTRLMFKEVKDGREQIITGECAKYVAANAKFPIFEPTEVAAEDLVVAVEAGEAGDALPESILAEIWMHGVPTDRLDPMAQDPGFLPALRGVLMDEGEAELWPNAVAALGDYGEEQDLALLEYIAGRD
jgi:hypothetical protein